MPKRAEVFNVRMEVKDTPAKRKRELGAMLGMMRDIINTHAEGRGAFEPEAFRIVVVALEDTMDPHLCPHCRPGFRCEAHQSVPFNHEDREPERNE